MLEEYTPSMIAKAIARAMHKLPDQEQEEIKRIYGKTWSVVALHMDGLVTPTKDCRARLLDLYARITRI